MSIIRLSDSGDEDNDDGGVGTRIRVIIVIGKHLRLVTKLMDPGAKLSFFKSQHLLAKEVSFRKVT